MYDFEQVTTFVYTNYRGETTVRKAILLSVRWGTTEWHPTPGWLLNAFDIEKEANRAFALDSCNFDKYLNVTSFG